MSREVALQVDGDKCYSTADERWTVDRLADPGHFYHAQVDYALANLPDSGKCLVVGSPIFEAMELTAKGLEVTYLDVRDPKIDGLAFTAGDATKMPFPDGAFDCASSTCVICHVGLGRYGDALVDDGDVKMLQELGRVLKSGGRLAITLGPVSAFFDIARIGRRHRIYSIKEAKRMCAVAGFTPIHFGVLDIAENKWVTKVGTNENLDSYYLSMFAEKA